MLKKQDVKLIIGILIVAIVLLIVTQFFTRQQGEQVEVLLDGALYGSYSLTENQSVEIESERGYNRLVIENGQVFMEEADCPDQYCVEHQAITNQNETIVCLPHRVVVQVTGNTIQQEQKTEETKLEELPIDGIAQ